MSLAGTCLMVDAYITRKINNKKEDKTNISKYFA